MSLARLLLVYPAVAAGVLLALGALLYGLAARDFADHSAASLRRVAETMGNQLARSIAATGALLDRLAEDPELAQALASGDPARILAAEERLTRIVPDALRVRLVPDSITVPDEARLPRMGFADLEMVRQTRTGTPPPAVHAANTPDAHVALARRLSQGGGVILASLAPGSLAAGLSLAPQGGAVELRQNSLSLAVAGEAALRTRPPTGTLPIAGTPWVLAYWSGSSGPSPLGFLALPAAAAAVLGVLGGFWGRRVGAALQRDGEAIAALVGDLLAGRPPPRPPMQVVELQRLADTLVQLKNRPPLSKPAPVAPSPPPPPPAAVPATPNPAVSPALFQGDELCGAVGTTLTADTLHWLGRAIASEARERGDFTVAIARDGRPSSPEFSQALARGLLEGGCSVIDLGLVPTPVLYFATHVLSTQSGVMVTGSGAPADHNGLKIVLAGAPLLGEELRSLCRRSDRRELSQGKGRLESRRLDPDYIERIVQDIQLDRELKVIVQCAHSAAHSIAPAVLTELGCEVLPLLPEGDQPGPDPSRPEQLVDLIQAVRHRQADLGVTFDSDGDRLGVVDSSGKFIRPDRLLMLFAADVLSREPGSDILFDVACSRHLAGQVVRHGGRPLMWRSGRAQLYAKLKETGAPLAGAMSGRIFFKERWYGFDDGIYACARLLEILSGVERPTAEVFAELPDSQMTAELCLPLASGESAAGLVQRLRALADFQEARLTDIDGLRLDFAEGWGLLRASPAALTLRFEADSAEALALVQNKIEAWIHLANPDISLAERFSSLPTL